MMDDSTAIEKCRNGDADAFRFLVERYQRQALGHAIAILGNRDDGLDAVQDSFVDAFKALKHFDLARRFYPWFYVLLRNRCFKFAAHTPPFDNIEDTEILAPQTGVSNEERIELEKALLSLSKESREIITLKYLEGLSYDELAERLDIPRGTVMSRLFYARRQLQKKLTGRFHSSL